MKNDSIYASCRTRASARQRVAHCETRSLSRTQLVKILHMLKAHTAQTHSHGRTPSVGNLLIQTWSGEGRGSSKLKFLPLQIVAITVGHLIWTPLRVWGFFFPLSYLICVSTFALLAHVCVCPWVCAPNVHPSMYPCMYFSRPEAINKPLVRHFCPKRPIEITAAHLSGKCVPLGVIL